jgi:DnaJ-class molecular chaperone
VEPRRGGTSSNEKDLASEAKRDYYEVLGVARMATEQEIKSAFERLAAEFRCSGKPRNIDDVEQIRAWATAYRTLSDGKKRRYYDRLGCGPPEDGMRVDDRWPTLSASGEDSDNPWADATELLNSIVDGILTGLD